VTTKTTKKPAVRKPKPAPEPVALEPVAAPVEMSVVSSALQAARNAYEGGDLTACHSAIMVALQEVRKQL
jgi:hypothetical protein